MRALRRDRKPPGYFSEKNQQRRNGGASGQGEEDLPIRKKDKRAAPDASDEESVPGKKRKREDPKPKALDEEALLKDLDTDYSKKKLGPLPKRPAKQKWPPVKTVITDRAKAPRGWNPEEPDLINDDLHAQIQRCRERIKENIMPHVYEYKLEGLLEDQKERDQKMTAEPGLGWSVVHRLENLQFILDWLHSATVNDKYKLASSITNVISAYRSGSLGWCHGFVTYWHNGAQICQPRPFRWNEFHYLYDKYNGNEEGFWVEGIDGPDPGNQLAVIECNTGTRKWGVEVSLALRIPGIGTQEHSTPFDFGFKDDTGADYMVIYDSDVAKLRTKLVDDGSVYPMPRLLGVIVANLGDGSKRTILAREVQVNMWDPVNLRYMADHWDYIPVLVLPGRGAKRLNGPWMRWKFYTASCPDNSKRLWIFDYNPSDPPPNGFKIPTATREQVNCPLPTAGNRYESILNHPHFNQDIPSGKAII